jgi:hypothetical protein
MLVRNFKSVSNVQLFCARNESLMASRDFWKQLGRFLDIFTERNEEDKENQVRIKLKCLSFWDFGRGKDTDSRMGVLERSSCTKLVQSVL